MSVEESLSRNNNDDIEIKFPPAERHLLKEATYFSKISTDILD